jgi:hypothetical protein
MPPGGGEGSSIKYTAFTYTAAAQTELIIEFDVPGNKTINAGVLTFNTNTSHSLIPQFEITPPGSVVPIK